MYFRKPQTFVVTKNSFVSPHLMKICDSLRSSCVIVKFVQVRSLLRSHSQGERSRASLAPGLYHPSPSIFSPSWSDRQGAVDDGAITGLRMRRSSAVRRPTPCHFSSLSSLLVHSSLFFWPSPPTVKFAGRSLAGVTKRGALARPLAYPVVIGSL